MSLQDVRRIVCKQLQSLYSYTCVISPAPRRDLQEFNQLLDSKLEVAVLLQYVDVCSGVSGLPVTAIGELVCELGSVFF